MVAGGSKRLPPSSWFLFNYSLAVQSGCRQLGWRSRLLSHSFWAPQCTTLKEEQSPALAPRPVHFMVSWLLWSGLKYLSSSLMDFCLFVCLVVSVSDGSQKMNPPDFGYFTVPAASLCVFKWNVWTTIGWTAMKFGAHIYLLHWVNCNNSGDLWPKASLCVDSCWRHKGSDDKTL